MWSDARIFVHRSCVNWISEVQSYKVENKVNDHAMDATGYVLAYHKTPRPVKPRYTSRVF